MSDSDAEAGTSDSMVVDMKIDDGTRGDYATKAETSQQVDKDKKEWGNHETYAPPFGPQRLADLTEQSETHAAAVAKKARHVAGFGFDVVPHPNAEDDEPAGENDVTDFWFGQESRWQLGPDEGVATPTEVLEHGWWDFEAIGWACYEILTSMDGTPTGLAHVPAHTVRRIKDQDAYVQETSHGETSYFGVAGNRYAQEEGDDRIFTHKDTGETGPDAAQGSDQANELIFIRNYSPKSSHYGTPDIVPALETLHGDLEARQYNTQFFENNATPRLLINVQGGELTKASRRSIRKSLRRQAKGTENAHRTVILEALSDAPPVGSDGVPVSDVQDVEIEIVPLTVGNDEDASFVEFRKENEHDILKAHEVPPVVAGRVENANYSTAEEQRREFAEEVVKPKQHTLAARLYNAIHKVALGVPGWTIEFETKGVDERRTEAEIADLKVRGQRLSGAATVNEVRETLGLEPRDDPVGEMFMQEFQNPSGAGGGGIEQMLSESVRDAVNESKGYSIVDTAAGGD